MARQITLELSDNLYARAQEIAAQQNQNVTEVITEIVNGALASQEQTADYLEADANVLREMDAYLELYPALVRDYPGEYVAIFQKQLVDRDVDFRAIMARIKAKYPNDFVLVKRIERVPIRSIEVVRHRKTANKNRLQ